MHFRLPYLTLLGFFTTSTIAINFCTGNKENLGYCEILTYVDNTTDARHPPTTKQCQNTCRGILADAGDWGVIFTDEPVGWKHRISDSDCDFLVGRGDGEPNEYKFRMDNQDIVDIIDEVNQRFGPLHNGRVTAHGTMRCEGHLATWYVER